MASRCIYQKGICKFYAYFCIFLIFDILTFLEFQFLQEDFVWRFISLLIWMMNKVKWKLLSYVFKSYNSNQCIGSHVALLYQRLSISFIFIKKQQMSTKMISLSLRCSVLNMEKGYRLLVSSIMVKNYHLIW